MRYITVSADYTSSGVKDLNDGELDRKQLGVSESLWLAIQKWVSDYSPIIMMESEERAAEFDKIHLLDQRGIEICKQIKTELKDVKVEYYSEGLLKKLII